MTLTFDPSCKRCAGTGRICECHLYDGVGEDYHPPHGRTWWEWNRSCCFCHEHVWGPPQAFSNPMRACSLCGILRYVHSAGMPPCDGCWRCDSSFHGDNWGPMVRCEVCSLYGSAGDPCWDCLRAGEKAS